MKKICLPMLTFLLFVGFNGSLLAQTITVSGAGTIGFNGTYSYDGAENGRPHYAKGTGYDNYVIVWNAYGLGGWCLHWIGGSWIQYINYNDTPKPPAGDWTTIYGGVLPAPTLTGDVDPLPVELTSFSASVKTNLVNLQWSTSTEVDNCGFEVQRRIVGETTDGWNAVGFVAGAGTNTSPHKYSYTDKNLSAGRYAYRIKQIDRDGSFKYLGNAEVEVGAPTVYSLSTNFPNPFNPTTTIRYALPTQSRVRIAVFNTLGQIVAQVVNAEQAAGWNDVVWNANVASGLYFYRLEAVSVTDPTKQFVDVKKLLFLK